MSEHPLAIDLVAAAQFEPDTEPIHEHLRGCAECQDEYDVIQSDLHDNPDAERDNGHGLDVGQLDDATIAEILAGAPSLPEPLIAIGSVQTEPAAGDLWQIGNEDEAILALLTQTTDQTARVVPVVLDVDMADEKSIYIPADASPLGVDAILINDLARTVPVQALIAWVGTVAPYVVDQAVAAKSVPAATIGDRLAFPIHHHHDERHTVRWDIEVLLDDLTATRPQSPDPKRSGAGRSHEWEFTYPFDELRDDLRARIFGSELHLLPRTTLDIGVANTLTCVAKVTYLQTTTVIVTLTGPQSLLAMTGEKLAAPCRTVLRLEPDANAIAVVLPVEDWATILFTSADTHAAVVAPAGHSEPRPTHVGYGLLDTMHKYLDSKVTAWQETDSTTGLLPTTDTDEITERHSTRAVTSIRQSGTRSREPKRGVWSNLPPTTDDAVMRFVQSLLDDRSTTEALAQLDTAWRESAGRASGSATSGSEDDA